MGDGHLDILWLNGQIPSTLYPTGNKARNGSRAEGWLDDGNLLINGADWFAWATHENGEKERNRYAGAANILGLPGNISIGERDTAMKVTAAGNKFILDDIIDEVIPRHWLQQGLSPVIVTHHRAVGNQRLAR